MHEHGLYYLLLLSNEVKKIILFGKMYIDDNFMLTNEAARELYHDSAESLPIIDYHCHLDPRMIAENYQFRNLAEIWLGGDHYKWRAMRGNGVPEAYITGDKSDYEKFEKWAETIPYAMRNPLYHWTHLELKRIFGIDQVLKPETRPTIRRTRSNIISGYRRWACRRRFIPPGGPIA